MSKEIKDQIQAICIEVDKDPPVKNWLSTGCTILDLAIRDKLPGGLPEGRIIQIFGEESSCKTVLGMTVLGAALRQGSLAFFGDSEGTFDDTWATLYGLDSANPDFFYTPGDEFPDTIEDFWDKWLAGIMEIETDKPKVVVVDSLSSISDSVEMSDNLDKGSYRMTKAKMLSAGFRKYGKQLMRNKITLVLIDQTRMQVGSLNASAVTTGGGMAVPFYSSTRIQLKVRQKVKNSHDKVEGMEIGFEIIKNKAGKPYRTGVFRILFDYGLDDVWSNINFLKLEQAGGGTRAKKFTFMGDTYAQIPPLIKKIDKENLHEELKKEVEALWKEIYKPTERQPRVWE